jgi:hypothetical protein
MDVVGRALLLELRRIRTEIAIMNNIAWKFMGEEREREDHTLTVLTIILCFRCCFYLSDFVVGQFY